MSDTGVRRVGVQPLRHGPVIHDDGTVTFRVWAPHADRVTIEVGEQHDDLLANGGGWFERRLNASPGTRYAYRLDAGDPRPDPASMHQPDGVHAPSMVVDRSAFEWSSGEARWQPTPLAAAVIYELHIGTFTSEGTFAAAANHLRELADLGVTHIEVMPVAAFNGPHGWGYAGVSWYAVHEPYGGPAAFAAFVDACHQHGLAVILDVVYNHFGPSGSYHAEFGPYQTDTHMTPGGAAINLDDRGADEVRAFIVDNACMWLADFHVDGLRLDAVHALFDGSAVHILEQLSAAVDRLSEQTGRPKVLIAESDRQDPRTVMPRAAGGVGLGGQWLDDLHHALHVTITGEDDGYYADYTGLEDVATVWTEGFAYAGRWSVARARTVGAALPPDVSARRFVACVQNHDQIGNRANGDRLTTAVDAERLRVAIALLCLSPTVPMLFMGEEYGETNPFLFFSSHPERWLADAVREGRREEFAAFAAFWGEEVPDPQDHATFAASVLDRSHGDTPEGVARRRLWHDLLTLRRSVRALSTGDRTLVSIVDVASDRLVAIRRDPSGAAPAYIAATADSNLRFELPNDVAWSLAWSSRDARYGETAVATALAGDQDSGQQCTVEPWTVVVLIGGNV